MDKIKVIARWVLTIPAGVLVAWLVFALSQVSVSFVLHYFLGLSEGSFFPLVYKHTVPYLLMGGVFIASVVKFAPSHPKQTAYVCAVLALLHSVLPFIIASQFLKDNSLNHWGVIGVVCEIAGVLLMTYAVRSTSTDLRNT
ncbi:MAG TPA: hypothetical protein DEV85_04675 [Vibrio sp.]|uniref:hypothetical protein n=1 Tax=Vibrio TaxID=662 RepID=UPI000EEB05F1|nr:MULTISPECIES: hypothetical protein [Vibrio]HCH01173.1 hypothetical protein [Vibrio sp.]